MSQTSSFSTTDSAPSDYARQATRDPMPTEADTQGTAEPATATRESGFPSLSAAVSASAAPTSMSIDSPSFEVASAAVSGMRVEHVPTVAAYDAWATVYDRDGNMLQGVDDMELERLLPELLASTVQSGNQVEATIVRIVDVGCGTGRNMVKILGWQGWGAETRLELVGVDASEGMLGVARNKLEDLQTPTRTFKLFRHDFLDAQDPSRPPVPFEHVPSGGFDALISTLVLEHFPIKTYFVALGSLLKLGARALVTNMHPDMGAKSQAGFVSTDGKGEAVKIRGRSWIHGVEETASAAREAGFEVLGTADRAVENSSAVLQRLGTRSRKWIGVTVWYALVLRKQA